MGIRDLWNRKPASNPVLENLSIQVCQACGARYTNEQGHEKCNAPVFDYVREPPQHSQVSIPEVD